MKSIVAALLLLLLHDPLYGGDSLFKGKRFPVPFETRAGEWKLVQQKMELSLSTLWQHRGVGRNLCETRNSPAICLATPERTRASRDGKVMTLSFGGVDYLHRWSKNGQNEFTPRGDADLETWRDMITINVHESVSSGDQLAELADRVATRYQTLGEIVSRVSKPRTSHDPAEHLIVAVLKGSTFLEAAFARFMLIDGSGFIAIYAHRVYGKEPGPEMREWFNGDAEQIEAALKVWDKVPALGVLKQLPQSQ